jgi:hypothetical protein
MTYIEQQKSKLKNYCVFLFCKNKLGNPNIWKKDCRRNLFAFCFFNGKIFTIKVPIGFRILLTSVKVEDVKNVFAGHGISFVLSQASNITASYLSPKILNVFICRI